MQHISPEGQAFIDEAVASGQFETPEAALDEAIRLLREKMQQNGQEAPNQLTAEAWCKRFEAWAECHRSLRNEADDSRESIYAGRGE